MSRAEPTSPPSSTYAAGILATGLAAAMGAVLTSFAGMQGTIVGAMLGAMVVSVLSQAVRAPLARLERLLLQVGLLAVRRRRGRAQAVRSVPTPAPAPRPALAGPGLGRRVATVGLLGFVIGMGLISLLEFAQGKPVSATTARQPGSGTTVGNLVRAQPATPEGTPPAAGPTAAAARPSPTAHAATPTATRAAEKAPRATPAPTAPVRPSPLPAGAATARPTAHSLAAP